MSCSLYRGDEHQCHWISIHEIFQWLIDLFAQLVVWSAMVWLSFQLLTSVLQNTSLVDQFVRRHRAQFIDKHMVLSKGYFILERIYLVTNNSIVIRIYLLTACEQSSVLKARVRRDAFAEINVAIKYLDRSYTTRAHFTNMDSFYSQHGQVITSIIKCGMKLLLHSHTLMVKPLNFGKLISDIIPHFTGLVIICPCWDLRLPVIVKKAPVRGNSPINPFDIL